jgi:hypothetical protein
MNRSSSDDNTAGMGGVILTLKDPHFESESVSTVDHPSGANTLREKLIVNWIESITIGTPNTIEQI